MKNKKNFCDWLEESISRIIITVYVVCVTLGFSLLFQFLPDNKELRILAVIAVVNGSLIIVLVMAKFLSFVHDKSMKKKEKK